jgi:hypothetical protein
MTDARRTSSPHPRQKYTKYTTSDGGAPEQAAPSATPPATPAAAPPTRGRPSATGGRIAAVGIGIAAMLGLVANMEVADGNAKAASTARSPALSAQRTAKNVREGASVAPGRVAAARVKHPIVLTPHAVVTTVSAPSSGSNSGGSSGGYAYSAPAPASAPVVSSGGS